MTTTTEGPLYARGRTSRQTPPKLGSVARVVVTNNLPPPTALERRLYAALERLGIRYVREMPFPPYRVDTWLPAWAIALEADSDGYHGCPEHYPEDADYHAHRRAYRDRRLLREHGLLVLHIWGCQMETADDAYRAVIHALRPHCADVLPLEGTYGES